MKSRFVEHRHPFKIRATRPHAFKSDRLLGVPFNRRGAMTNEYLTVIKASWTQDKISFDGEFVSFTDAATTPRPVQRPHPPIWIGGASDAAVRRAVRLGDAWHPIRIKTPHFADHEIPRLQRMAEQEGKPMPALCPRLRFNITESAIDGPERFAGEGSLSQVHRDLAELEALGCEHVILDTYHDDVDATRHPPAAWSILATMADKVLDLPAQAVR